MLVNLARLVFSQSCSELRSVVSRRLSIIVLMSSLSSFHTPVISLTFAWPPSFPSVPTSRATRVTFADLCGAPLGPADYLAIASRFQTVFVERIPALKAAERNAARRFVTLIDTLYDARERLVASCEKAPEDIVPGSGQRPGFARTVSRLREMQSASWWGKKIAET